MKEILFLTVGFNNSDEVAKFTEQVEELNFSRSFSCKMIVVINKGKPEEFRDALSIYSDVTIYDPKDNLGYLGACAYGLREYLRSHSLPEWVCITNTDLILDKSILDILLYDHKDIGQISPETVTEDYILQNPHIMVRPTQLSMMIKIAIHYFTVVGSLYILLSKLKPRGKQSSCESSGTCYIYSSHGSHFYLNKRYFEAGGEIFGAPFLYSEEIFIGEQLRLIGLKSLCVRERRVIHSSHQTTSLVSISKLNGFIRDANIALFKKYFC